MRLTRPGARTTSDGARPNRIANARIVSSIAEPFSPDPGRPPAGGLVSANSEGVLMSHAFGFGLWTLMHAGVDPSGRATRTPLAALGAISGLAAHGVQAFELHAEDLIPPGSTADDRDRLVREARRIMNDTGIICAA